MKHIKKVVTLFLAFAMVLAMSATVFAAGHTISVKDDDTHTYRVFQVLTGTLAEEGSKQLGNPAWGADAIAEPGDVNAFIDSISEDGLSDQDIAQMVAAKVDTTGTGQGTVKAGAPLEDLATGYYVLVDETELTGDHVNDTKALHVVKVVNDIDELDIKWGTTESDKEIVSDTLGPNDEENEVSGDVDNVSIGDTVNFKIEATIPANANLYNYFYFVINDTLDPGLTLDKDSIKVFIEGEEDPLEEEDDYLVKTGEAAGDYTFQVGMVNAKALAGKTIIVTYSAVLNENAKIGELPNNNTQTVTFSNDPNHDYNGEGENPGFPDEEDEDVLGVTPENTTETFTTGIEIQKVDQDGNVLTGAEFTIEGDSTEIVLVSSETFTEDANGEYYGLKDGTYTKAEPVTEDSMKPAAAGATKGYVVAESGYDGEDAIEVGGVTYRPVKEGDTGTVYILVKANAGQYDGNKYNKTVTYTQKNTTEGVTATAEVGPDGVVRFVGLGAGTYTITETKTPSGYNTLDPVEVEIEFTESPAEGSYHWSTTSTGATYNSTTGVFEMTIVNQQGSELPETGGIGTMVFYVLGTLLVVGCGIVLISKRRMENR